MPDYTFTEPTPADSIRGLRTFFYWHKEDSQRIRYMGTVGLTYARAADYPRRSPRAIVKLKNSDRLN